MIIWVLLCLFFGGGSALILFLTGLVDGNSGGGPVGRTTARYARENEQWVQTAGFPMLFNVFVWGGLFGFGWLLMIIFGHERGANIFWGIIFYGVGIFVVLAVLACIGFGIWIIIALFGNGSSDKKNEYKQVTTQTKPITHTETKEQSKQDQERIAEQEKLKKEQEERYEKAKKEEEYKKNWGDTSDYKDSDWV
jgi:hypothetical protein